MKNTLIIALLAVTISTLIGISTGWAFGRRRLPGKEILMALILLPRMIPPITYALGVARIFYGLELVNTHLGWPWRTWPSARPMPSWCCRPPSRAWTSGCWKRQACAGQPVAHLLSRDPTVDHARHFVVDDLHLHHFV